MKKILKKILGKTGYQLSNKRFLLKPFRDDAAIIKLNFDHVLCKYLDEAGSLENFYFLQIGAFDGVTCDPLRKYLLKYNWKGVMMEPQPVPFHKLSAEYASRNEITVLNAAIAKQDGFADLYTIDSPDVPVWSKGMASFSKENILKHKHLIPGLESCIKKVEVDTFSFESIFSKFSLPQLDLLQIDTEGFDAAIINMFPFDKIKPSIIHFESKHIPRPELEKTLAMLIDMGYHVARDGEEDMMAVLQGTSK